MDYTANCLPGTFHIRRGMKLRSKQSDLTFTVIGATAGEYIVEVDDSKRRVTFNSAEIHAYFVPA